jgi:hypothetical protein
MGKSFALYSNDSATSCNPDWWCGLDTACNAEPTRNFIFTLPFTATNILANGTTSPGCSSSGESTTTSGSVATVTVTTTASNAPSTSSISSNGLCAVHSNTLPSGAIAGLAVLGVVALFSIEWALWENRARRRQGRTVSNGAFEPPRYGQATKFRWVPCLAMVATATGRSMRRMGGCCRMKWMQDVSCYLTVKGSSTNQAHAPWYMNPIAPQQRSCWRQASPSKQQLDWDAVGLQTVVSRPAFRLPGGVVVAWWWRFAGRTRYVS